jgi:hypothetical protein
MAAVRHLPFSFMLLNNRPLLQRMLNMNEDNKCKHFVFKSSVFKITNMARELNSENLNLQVIILVDKSLCRCV